jgi:hypothetical protein
VPFPKFSHNTQKQFPLFEQLPYDRLYDINFFKEDLWLRQLRPRHHWCFLVEITKVVQCIVPPLRPMYLGKDAIGEDFFIAFHTVDKSPHIKRDCRVGDTLAIMYAESHSFLDGQVGIRVEMNEHVKVRFYSNVTV